MNICFYNVTAGLYLGGLETYCWEVGHQLALRGHGVVILAGSGGAIRYGDVKLIEFPFRKREDFPNFGTRFQKLMERCSFALHAVPHLLKTPYDVIIINKPFDFPALWLARKKGMNSKTIFRSGGTDFFAGDHFFSRSVDFWVSTSRYNANQIEKRYRCPVRVIPNGVDVEQFRRKEQNPQFRHEFGIPKEGIVIASCGRLIGWKGLHIILEAIAGIPWAHYLIIGDGPERERLQQMTTRLALGERVHFTGTIAHAALPSFLSESDIFVQPSLGEEAFGISMVEAMACEVPVFGSRNGGITEVVVDQETGLLLPPGDVRAWREAMVSFRENPNRFQNMGREGRKRVEREFTWGANAWRLEEMIAENK